MPMVTKAELEKQVADLKRQLEEKTVAADEAKSGAHGAREKLKETIQDIPGKLSDEFEDWSGEIDTVLQELDSLPHKKAILFALGVFALGYMVGRSR